MGELRNMNENSRNGEDSAQNGLTGIESRIHWPATHISGGSITNELDTIAVDNFLDTLADVALAIAARKCSENKDQERDS